MKEQGGFVRFKTGFVAALSFFVVAFAAAAPAQADWQLPATNLRADAGIYEYSDIAVGPDGAITVTWLTETIYGEGGGRDLMVSTRPPGSNLFGPAQLLESRSGDTYAEVETAPNGDTTVVWIGKIGNIDDGSRDAIKVVTRRAGSTSFGPPEILASTGGEASTGLSNVDLAVGPRGNTEVVWSRWTELEFDGDEFPWRHEVETASRPAGANSFQAFRTLDVFESIAQPSDGVDPNIASGPDGLTTVIWHKLPISAAPLPNPQAGLFTTTRPANSSDYGQPVKIGDFYSTVDSDEIEIGTDGRTTVVWFGSDLAIQQATRPAGSTSFSSPEALSAPANDPATLDRAYPELAFDPAGRTTVVWEQSKGSRNTIIQSATRPAGSDTFGKAVDLSTRKGWSPEVAVGPDGETTVVWWAIPDFVSPNRIPGAMEAASRPAGSSAFGPPVDLSAAYPRGGERPGVVTAPSGKTTAIWNGQADPSTVLSFGAFLTDKVGGSGQPSLGGPKVTGPSKAKVNKRATFQVQVSNVGSAAATGVSIKAVGKGASATKSVGDLAGGQTETVPISIKFTKKGRIPVTFAVSASNADKKSVKKTVKVG